MTDSAMGCGKQGQGHFALSVMVNPEAVWLGVVTATCSAVRALRLDDGTQQIACVYDTGLDGNPSHAEIGWTATALADEGDAPSYASC